MFFLKYNNILRMVHVGMHVEGSLVFMPSSRINHDDKISQNSFSKS